MKYLLSVILLGLLAHPVLMAQTTYAVQDTAYVRLVEHAFSSLKQGNCQSCLGFYKKALALSQKSAISTLRAAVCAYQCQQTDQAHTYISKATSLDFWVSEDVWDNRKDYPEFDILRTSPLAADFQDGIDNQKIAEGRNPTLERELKVIFRTDNQPRLRLDSLGKQYGFNSPQTKSIWEEVRRADSINLPKIERILQQYGYPGKHLVGEKQNVTTWLVIQHAPLAVQEKYLPLIQKAADQGELGKSNLALLIDRIRIYRGQKQLYGSQVTLGADGKNSFDPIEDEVNVDKRRAEVGLSPLKDYARQWNIEYVPPKK